ncbi:MAG TPA: hypothetical protein VL490_00270 [Mucilaginibacter sp.]|jgi:hypothetical protein|nr:hypothetical protein [Mucilaginibacter sp.]
MKTLKTIMLSLTLLLACSFAKASDQPAQALSKNDVLEMYTNAVIHGKIEGVEKILANDVEYNMYRGERLFTMNKQSVLESLKSAENVEQSCKYNTSIVEDTEDGMIVKLTMKYDNYTRVNLITISLKKADWKITKIETRSA